MTDLIENLRRAILGNGAGRSDDELLSSFIERHDEAALAILVKRHGPMVWGVSRRLLAHHDAEDAFQATFLVLVRKASSVVPRTAVGNWLYGVAHQTALHARRTASRRMTREVQVQHMPDAEAARQNVWSDLKPVLDEELRRLPDIYRSVLVLCDLEGQTRKEVARQLGVPDGTVGGRLARARVLLANRLAQRGIVLSGGALAGVLATGSASVSASPALVAYTIEVASLLAAGRAAGMVSVKVAALTKGVVKAMFVSKIKCVLSTVLAVVTLCGVTGFVCRMQASEEPMQLKSPGRNKPEENLPLPSPPSTVVQNVKAKPVEKKTKSNIDLEMLQGKWLMVSETYNGNKEEYPANEERTMTFKKSSMSHADPAGGGHYRFRLNAGKTPSTIEFVKITIEDLFDLTDPNDLAVCNKKIEKRLDDDLERVQGIYSIEGDTLRLCISNKSGNRPSEFEGNKASLNILYIFKRAKGMDCK